MIAPARMVRAAQDGLGQIAHWLLIAAVAWGSFAFGAVYPWAYWPLFAVVAFVGVAGLLVPSMPAAPRLKLAGLAAAMVLFLAAALVQLVPLPLRVLTAVSRDLPTTIGRLDPTVATGLRSVHALSIWPFATLTGVLSFGALLLFLIGSARLLSFRGVRPTADAIVIIGVVLALTGIIQQPLYAGKIYGFWTPREGGAPYGPFVNRNHFAGWMALAIPLALGLVCAAVVRGMKGVKPTFRDRLLWFGSTDASRLSLLLGATAVMTLSLLLSASRSGISALALSVLMTLALLVRTRQTASRSIIAAALVVSVIGIVAAWTGIETIVNQFLSASGEYHGRIGAWQDAIAIARRFPWTGTGLNTYGMATLFYQTHDVSQHYAQAHNDYLQLAAEGGLLLVIPSLLIVVMFLRTARARFADDTSVTTYWIRAGALTGMTAIALQEIADFSLQMPGNAVLCAVLAAIVLHRGPDHVTRASHRTREAAQVSPR